MQSNVKTRNSRKINQVFATFPKDEKLSSKQKMDQINIPPQTHKDEISNKNKYNILNKDKERQLNQQLAIINQHSHCSLNTSLPAFTSQYHLKEN